MQDSLFFLSLLSLSLIGLSVYLYYKIHQIKRTLKKALQEKELYHALFHKLPFELILLKNNSIIEINQKALENLGINFNLSNLKERFKNKGKYYEILEIPLPNVYKMLVLIDITEKEGMKEAYQIALSYLSHELKTPLAVASSYLERLEPHFQKAEVSVEAKENFEKVLSAFNSLKKLLKKLFSSIEYLAKDIKIPQEPFKLKEAIEEAVLWVTPLAEEKKVLIDYHIKDDITLHGSLDLFIQALFNLIENAVKFSPPGEKVIIKGQYLTADMLLLTIRDFGPGVSPEKIAFLGKPFFKLSEGEGMGLGLFIAKRIIEAHKGEIKFNLPSEGGLEINIKLPLKHPNTILR
ncbi:MAG: sensor histidine kinase [Caldimicrobium sp.]